MMDEQERRESTEAEKHYGEAGKKHTEAEKLYAEAQRQHTEAGDRYNEAEKHYTDTREASKQSGIKRREEAKQQQEQEQQQPGAALEQLTDATRQSFQMLADRTVSLQESNLQLTQNFFQNWIEQVQSQTEGNRQAAQTVQEQGERQQQALQTLTQESTHAPSEVWKS